MTTEAWIYAVTTVIGAWVTWRLMRSRWPGWVGMPLFILAALATRDLGVSPMVLRVIASRFDLARIFGQFSSQEALAAYRLMLLCYLSIAAGLVLARVVGGRMGEIRSAPPEGRSPRESDRAWRVSFGVMAIGLAAHLAVIAFLVPSVGLLGIAAHRAVYTAVGVLENPLFGYSRLLSTLMEFGALGMVLFAGRNRTRLRLGIAADVLFMAIEALYGGRGRVILSMAALLLVIHHGVRRLRLRDVVRVSVYAVAGLAFITVVRMRAATAGEIFQNLLISVSSSGYSQINNTAFVMRTYPGIAPFTGAWNAVGSVARFLPGLSVPGTDTLWGHLIDVYYGGQNPIRGIGGVNFSTAAEFYSWGGLGHVVLFGILGGLGYGAFFEWQRHEPANRFLMLLSILIVAESFFGGVQSRMPDSFGSIGFILVPVGLMAALTRLRQFHRSFLLFMYFELTVFVAWFFLRWPLLRLAIILSVSVVYLFVLVTLRRADPPPERQPPPLWEPQAPLAEP